MAEGDMDFREPVDITEPEPLTLVRGVENPYDEPFLWRVELYLMSKYAPEFVAATIWKVRSAALERAKAVKEHHVVMNSAQFESALSGDLDKYVEWTPPRHGKSMTASRKAPTPGISRDYEQRTL